MSKVTTGIWGSKEPIRVFFGAGTRDLSISPKNYRMLEIAITRTNQESRISKSLPDRQAGETISFEFRTFGFVSDLEFRNSNLDFSGYR